MQITESDTRAKYFDPRLKESGWEQFVTREYYFTDGRKYWVEKEVKDYLQIICFGIKI